MFVNKKQHTNYLTGFVALLISLSTNASGGNSTVDAEQAQLSEFYLAHEAKLESRESDFGTSRYHLGMSRSPRMPKGLGITRDREHVFVTNFDALVWNGKKTGGVAVLPMPNSDGEVESGYQVIPSSWSNNGYMSGNAEILVHPDGKRVFASRIEGTHKEGR